MICPNCKTELVEVNGRYICSDCGREIPENEVMASDWGNGGTARAGLYGAGTDEVVETGSKPVTDYSASLTETENEIGEEATVEEIIQEQLTDKATPEAPVDVPTNDTGFYVADKENEVVLDDVAEVPPIPVIPTVAEEPFSVTPEGSLDVARDDSVEAIEPVVETVPIPVVPDVVEAPVVEPLPVSVIPDVVGQSPVNQDSLLQGNDTGTPVNETPPAPVIPTVVEESSSEHVVESAPALPEVQEIPITPSTPEIVKDMFEPAVVATAPLAEDPGIYTDPMYEGSLPSQPPVNPTVTTNSPMPADKKINLIVIIAGSIFVLLLVIGGIWAYIALNKTAQPVNPVVELSQITWQELQVVDGGFKIKFPGEPVKTDLTQIISGTETGVTSYVYVSDEVLYSASFAKLESEKTKTLLADAKTTLPVLVQEVADPKNFTVSDIKVGKYYTADAIDFTLSSDTASFSGKLMIEGNVYILLMAGSDSGQTADYNKFIKSFGLITTLEETN